MKPVKTHWTLRARRIVRCNAIMDNGPIRVSSARVTFYYQYSIALLSQNRVVCSTIETIHLMYTAETRGIVSKLLLHTHIHRQLLCTFEFSTVSYVQNWNVHLSRWAAKMAEMSGICVGKCHWRNWNGAKKAERIKGMASGITTIPN